MGIHLLIKELSAGGPSSDGGELDGGLTSLRTWLLQEYLTLAIVYIWSAYGFAFNHSLIVNLTKLKCTGTLTAFVRQDIRVQYQDYQTFYIICHIAQVHLNVNVPLRFSKNNVLALHRRPKLRPQIYGLGQPRQLQPCPEKSRCLVPRKRVRDTPVNGCKVEVCKTKS